MEIIHPEALRPRKTPRQTRSEATVDAIHKATIQVLLTEGWHRLTTTRVAERAGVSVGTMYQYFPHKQALLYAVVHVYLDEFVEGFERACLEYHGETIAVLSKGLVDAFVDIKIRQPDVTRAVYRVAAELDTYELVIGMSSRMKEAASVLLASAADARFNDLPDLSFTLLTAMNGTTRAVFECGAKPQMINQLRTHLLALCHGFLRASALQAGVDQESPGPNQPSR